MDFDVADYAVKYAVRLGADYAEARLEKTAASSFLLKNGIPEISGFDRSTGLGLRFIVNGVLGFCSTNILEKQKIKNLIGKSLRNQQSASRLIDKRTQFSAEVPEKDRYEVKAKIGCADISPEDKISFLEDLEKSLGPRVSTYFSLHDAVKQKYFVSSDGGKVYSKIPTIDFFYYLTVKNGSETAQRYWQHGNTAGWEALKQWKLEEEMPARVKVLKKTLKNAKRPPKDKIDLVVGPEIAGIIAHESGGHPYEADRILGREAAQAGESFISPQMIGHKMAPPIINVVDDPTLVKTFGFMLYDDEGIRAQKKYLIREGRINEFLTDRQSAFSLDIKNNGSSRATAYDREPIVRMSNTFIEPADLSEEELIEEVKLGVFMKNFTEWNIDDKRVHQKYVGGECYLIVDGQLQGLVKRPVLEISTHSLYAKMDGVADNLELHAATCGKGEPMQGIRVSIGGPTVKIKDVRLNN